jgi:hypothetical protein
MLPVVPTLELELGEFVDVDPALVPVAAFCVCVYEEVAAPVFGTPGDALPLVNHQIASAMRATIMMPTTQPVVAFVFSIHGYLLLMHNLRLQFRILCSRDENGVKMLSSQQEMGKEESLTTRNTSATIHRSDSLYWFLSWETPRPPAHWGRNLSRT